MTVDITVNAHAAVNVSKPLHSTTQLALKHLELLPRVPYKDLKPVEIELPPRQSQDYKRPKKSSQRFVPEIY